jgi:hypothetical protein
MALIYSAGYVWAALARDPWLKRVERVNVTASLVLPGILLLLLTPAIDPARVSVNSQVARLQAGEVVPADFDYDFLRFDAGRYGADALAALANDPRGGEFATLAKVAQAQKGRGKNIVDTATAKLDLSQAKIYPKGAELPEGFIQRVRDAGALSLPCRTDTRPCEIYVLSPDSVDEPILMIRQSERTTVFKSGATGAWESVGIVNSTQCPSALDALRQGKISAVRGRHDDFVAGGVRLNFQPWPEKEFSDICQDQPPP